MIAPVTVAWAAYLLAAALGQPKALNVARGDPLPLGRWTALTVGSYTWFVPLQPKQRVRFHAKWPGAKGRADLRLTAVVLDLDEVEESALLTDLPVATDADQSVEGEARLIAGANGVRVVLRPAGAGVVPLLLRVDLSK